MKCATREAKIVISMIMLVVRVIMLVVRCEHNDSMRIAYKGAQAHQTYVQSHENHMKQFEVEQKPSDTYKTTQNL